MIKDMTKVSLFAPLKKSGKSGEVVDFLFKKQRGTEDESSSS